MDSRLDMVVVEAFESREGGRASANVAVDGDCSLEDGTDTTTGEDTEVPLGLPVFAAGLGASDELEPAIVALLPLLACSLTPTEARRRLYRPLKPLWTSSMPLGSSEPGGAGGAARSSKVVSVSERDAVACIWWSVVSCSRPCASLAMAATGTSVQVQWNVADPGHGGEHPSAVGEEQHQVLTSPSCLRSGAVEERVGRGEWQRSAYVGLQTKLLGGSSHGAVVQESRKPSHMLRARRE